MKQNVSIWVPGFPGAFRDPGTNPYLLPILPPSAQKFKFHWGLEANRAIHAQGSET